MELNEKARAIIKLESEEAAERIDALPMNRRVDLVLSLPSGKKRMDLILMSSRPEELTRAIPPEDLVLSIKDLGDMDAVPILEMSSNRQLNYLFDLELWIREGMDLGRLLHWIEILFECGNPRVLQWLDSVDFELLVLFFERSVLLLERDELESLPDRLSGRVHSPDNTHYLLVKLGANYGLLKNFIDLIFAEVPDLFFALTGNLGTTPLAEVEELAYRWRTGRLADRGWPDLDEALLMYQPTEPDQVRPRDRLPFGMADPPRFPLEHRNTGELLQAGVARLEDNPKNIVASQMANLINRMIIAGGMIPGETESLKRASEHVKGGLEIGLTLLGATEADASARLLKGVPLVDVFRVAQGAIQKRVRRARIIMAKKSAGMAPTLPIPLSDCIKALLASRPLFVSLKDILPREFSDPADLAMLDRNLDLIEAAFVVGDVLGLKRSALATSFSPGTWPESPEGLTFYTLLLTGFARNTVRLETKVEPLPFELLPRLFDRLPREQNALFQEIRDWATSLIDPRPPGLDHLIAELTHLAWQEILVHDPDQLDPRFVEGLWLKK
jgi:hypothetical protein